MTNTNNRSWINKHRTFIVGYFNNKNQDEKTKYSLNLN